MTQEFHVSITPIRTNEYLVRTEEVSPGVPLAEEQVVWPTLEWLAIARQLMNDPIVGLLRGDRISSLDTQSSSGAGASAAAASNLVALGQQLYSHLFQGRLRDSWMTAQGIAQHRGEALRIRLGLKGPELPRLPWEVLSGGVNEGLHVTPKHLATGIDILFSRYLANTVMAGATLSHGMAKPTQSLNILMAIAAPTDQQQLKLKQEAEHLQNELRLNVSVLKSGFGHRIPDIRVTILEQPGREELTQALEQGHYQVFHFAGHSDLGKAGGQIYLVNRQTGLSESVSGNDLAGLLLNNDIQMAVFNSCKGAHTATSTKPENQSGDTLTEALVSRGIPAVLAMAEQIPDDVALTLTRLFYRNLKQDYPVDLSLSRARQGLLSAYSSEQLYWALPVLYMHPDFDGYLMEGDRSLDNPADSLIRLPHLYAPPLTDPLPQNYTHSIHGKAEDEGASSVSETSPVHATRSDYTPHVSAPASEPTDTPPIEPSNITNTLTDSNDQTFVQGRAPTQFQLPTSPSIHQISSSVSGGHSVVTNTNRSPELDTRSEPASTSCQNSSNFLQEDSSHPYEHSLLDEPTDFPDDSFLTDADLNLLDDNLNHDDLPSNKAQFDDTISEIKDAPELGHDDLSDMQESLSMLDLVEQLESEQELPVHDVSPGNTQPPADQDMTAFLAETNGSRNLLPSQSSRQPSSPQSLDATSIHQSLSNNKTKSSQLEKRQSGLEKRQSGLEKRQSAELSHPTSTSNVDPALLERRRSRSPFKRLRRALWLPLISIAGAGTVLLGYHFVPQFKSSSQLPQPGEIVPFPKDFTPIDLPDADTRSVTEFGMASFTANQPENGQAAVQELLNRGELDAARIALSSATENQGNDPVISFLEGRLAWQEVHEENIARPIEDARIFWNYAAKKSSDPLFYNALGFAFYSEGRAEEAIDAWKQALNILHEKGVNVFPGNGPSDFSSQLSNPLKIEVPPVQLSHPDAITAYAGIALASAQLSAITSTEEPYDLLNQAVQIRQVVTQSASGLKPKESGYGWLWTDALTQEWEIFKGVSPQ